MLITFEGGEGSGKTTIAKRLAEDLRQYSVQPVILTTQPGGSIIGKKIRAILLDANNTQLCTTSELLLYMADRAQHSAEVIEPALAQGCIVISDRYSDSSFAYQGFGNGHDLDMIRQLSKIVETPHSVPTVTLFLDVDPRMGLARARGRNIVMGIGTAEGRFEDKELSFHTKVREGYLQAAKENPERFVTIDTTNLDLDDVYHQIKHVLSMSKYGGLFTTPQARRSPLLEIDKADGEYVLNFSSQNKSGFLLAPEHQNKKVPSILKGFSMINLIDHFDPTEVRQ